MRISDIIFENVDVTKIDTEEKKNAVLAFFFEKFGDLVSRETFLSEFRNVDWDKSISKFENGKCVAALAMAPVELPAVNRKLYDAIRQNRLVGVKGVALANDNKHEKNVEFFRYILKSYPDIDYFWGWSLTSMGFWAKHSIILDHMTFVLPLNRKTKEIFLPFEEK